MSTALASHANRVAKQLTGRDYVSYSALSTYASCPLRYYYRYVAGLPEQAISASLAFGCGIHSAIEHHFNMWLASSTVPDHDMLLAAFWESWRAKAQGTRIEFAKGEDETSIGPLADRVLSAFQQSEVARPEGAILGVEEELRGMLVPGVPDLLARIDLIVETERELVVTDFKSSRSRWNQAQASSAGEQLLLYSELARQLAPGKALRLEFAVVTKSKEPVVERFAVPVDPHRVARTKRVMKEVWRAIQAGVFYPAPSPMQCPTCPFRGPCRSWTGT